MSERTVPGTPRHRTRRAVVAAATAVLALLATTTRAADRTTMRQQIAKIRQEALAAGTVAVKTTSTDEPNFGTQDITAVEIQSYAFQPGISNDLLLDDGNGYRYYGAATADPYMAAPVQIPTGVMIDFIKLSDCTINNGDLVLTLVDNGANGEPSVPIVTLTDPGGGCGTASMDASYLYSQSAHHPLYFVLFWGNSTFDGTIKFNNAQVYYHRVVSPAPATATFADVPTSDFGFQFVEALAASGITGGCGGSNYCPDSPVTRRQMAIFLAKALGLHWPF
jgi:S-layer homology domain